MFFLISLGLLLRQECHDLEFNGYFGHVRYLSALGQRWSYGSCGGESRQFLTVTADLIDLWCGLKCLISLHSDAQAADTAPALRGGLRSLSLFHTTHIRLFSESAPEYPKTATHGHAAGRGGTGFGCRLDKNPD